MPLSRDRLTALLAVSALTSVELVIAPPGYGKTTVLREYAAADPSAVFISLPEATDLEAFVHSVIAEAAPSALHSIGALFDGTGEQSIEERVSDWLVSRLRAFNGTLIVDDFHRSLADERVARVLVATIAATHGRMRWIVASRESPPFPMGSWIARGWMGLPINARRPRLYRRRSRTRSPLPLDIAIKAEDVEAHRRGNARLADRRAARVESHDAQACDRQTRVQTRDALFALLRRSLEAAGPDLRELIAAAALMSRPRSKRSSLPDLRTREAAWRRSSPKCRSSKPIDDDAFAVHDLFREFVASQSSRNPAAAGDVAVRMGSALVAGGNPADGLRLLIAAGNVEGTRDALARHAFNLFETGQRSILSAALAFLSKSGLDDDGVALAIRGVLVYSDGSARQCRKFVCSSACSATYRRTCAAK